MKTKATEAPLRGEAAWRAEKLRIAQSKAQAERGVRDRAIEAERRAADRRDFAVRPAQPKP